MCYRSGTAGGAESSETPRPCPENEHRSRLCRVLRLARSTPRHRVRQRSRTIDRRLPGAGSELLLNLEVIAAVSAGPAHLDGSPHLDGALLFSPGVIGRGAAVLIAGVFVVAKVA